MDHSQHDDDDDNGCSDDEEEKDTTTSTEKIIQKEDSFYGSLSAIADNNLETKASTNNGVVSAVDNTQEGSSCMFEDSWGPSLFESAQLPLRTQPASVADGSQLMDSNKLDQTNNNTELYMDSTEQLKDHSQGSDYRRKNFSHSKRSYTARHLHAFKNNSSMSKSPRSSDAEEPYSRDFTSLSSIDDYAAAPPAPTLNRSSSAPIETANNMPPPPPTFMVAKSGILPISEWNLTNSNSNLSSEGSSAWSRKKRRRRRPLLSLRREKMTDSIAWFSFHVPKCVFEDLINSNELKKVCNDDKGVTSLYGEKLLLRRSKESKSSLISSDDTSLSSLSDGDESKQAVAQQQRQSLQCILKMPYSAKRDCALLFVDISGFTKLSTILDEESLSKVINTYFGLLINEVNKYGGDILKFAGDAFFAEWRVITRENVEEEKLRMEQNHPLTNIRASFLSFDTNNEQPEKAIIRNTMEERSMVDCVLAASQCAASIVKKYSDFQVQTSCRELSISFGSSKDNNSRYGGNKGDAILSVHGGIGCGSLVGLHVGDDNDNDSDNDNSAVAAGYARREFLFLGEPINQVSLAEASASSGEVCASQEVIQFLKEKCHIPDFITGKTRHNVCIASGAQSFFHPYEIIGSRPVVVPAANALTTGTSCQTYTATTKPNMQIENNLIRLHRELSLYVHHVVRDDELDALETNGSANRDSAKSTKNRHLAEAELRLVYTMFINAKINATITGDEEKDGKLFEKLQRIMQVTCRELRERKGQLRQFIVDDKGVVLIGTFGLRGSTFPNMIPNNALPATIAIHEKLKSELQVDNTIGATAGKAYCGVVGGVHRHEFAVMGAPVNLAARLMTARDNNGILVDETVQAGADSRFNFKRLPPVNAKGYDKPVLIFEPIPIHDEHNRLKRNRFSTTMHSHKFIGREEHVAELMDVSKSIIDDPDSQTIMVFIIGEPGIGKSALGLFVHEEMKLYASSHRKKFLFYRSTSTETEQRIPLSSFRKVFLGAVRDFCIQDGTLAAVASHDERAAYIGATGASQRRVLERRGSMNIVHRKSITRTITPSRLGITNTNTTKRLSRMDSNHSLRSSTSQKSTVANIPYLKKLCDICEELDYPHEFADIVGSQLLGLDGANPTTHIEGREPTTDEVVDFLSDAFIKLTEESNLTIIFLDDFQWIDSFTWKVIRALCDKGKNVLIMGAMRSQETQALRRMSSVASWHTRMQSRKGIIEVNIGPLESDEVKKMMSHILGYDESIIDDQLSQDIYQKTGGITIYIIELLQSIKRNNTVAVDEETGLLRWTPEAAREQKRIGSNRVPTIELSFLNRFDSLDIGVRRVLQTCAVLGMSFSLSDVIRVHGEIDELILERSLDLAVDELILVEDVEDDDDDDLSVWSGNGSRMESRNASWDPVDDRFFQFSHAMWRKSVLDAMLSEVKVHLHRTIAEALEKEQVLVMESSDIGWLLTLFDHWKSCGNFCKAAPLALAVGLRLEEWDLSAQSLDLYRDALEMCYESADNPDGGAATRDEHEVWLPASAPPATVEFILRLHIRIAKCHAHLGEQEQCATTFEDAYKIMTTSPKAAKLNQELVLPIISGLCSIAIQRNLINSSLLAENEELVDRFVHEAQERNDEIHVSRSLAMKASFFARLGKFREAIATQKELEKVYEFELHSAGIRQEYGKDHAVQSYADSVQWYMLTGNQPAAEQQIKVVVSKLLPQCDLRDVDLVMELIFPVLLVLKSIGRARHAETILFNNAINPYHDLGGSSSSWIRLFNPIAYLFEIIKMIEEDDRDDQMLSEIEDWVTDPERSIFSSDLQYKGYALVGEICSHLARIKIEKDEDPEMVLERGRMVLTRVVYAADDDKSDAYMVQMARFALDNISEMEDNSEVDNSRSSDQEGLKTNADVLESGANGGPNGKSNQNRTAGARNKCSPNCVIQ